MKKISFRLIFAALAATAVLAGCAKEITPGKVDSDSASRAAEGSRVIAVSFAAQPQTKTTLEKDGLTPNFVNGDKILVANGQDEPDTCIVSVNGGKATISTNLTGPLNAVYPAKAAKMNDSNPKQIDTVLVSANQSGTFADANICMAKDITNEAVFENKTAVLRFYVGSEIEVTSVTLESQSESFGPDIGTKITVNASEEKTLYEQMPKNQDRRVCYIAVPNGTFSLLTITTTAKTQNPEPKQLTDVTFENNKIYTVFIPYYIDVDDQKWGYCNVGAFYPEDPGYYFSWGNVNGHRLNGADDTYLFDNNNYQETDGAEVMEKLTPESDAARQFWGPSYRVPTIDDFTKTFVSSSFWVSHNFERIIGGFLYETESSELFLPAAGYYDMKETPSFLEYDNEGRYWTSLSSDSDNATIFRFGKSALYDQIACRYEGHPIRPIYDPAPTPEKPTSLSGEFTVGENKKVRFSRGNLYWDETTSPGAYKFETEQYFYRHYPGKTDDVAFLGGGGFETTPVGTVGGFWWTKKGETAFYPYSESFDSSISISTSDCLFTNGAQEQANSDFTVNGETGVWRTLSGGPYGEWNYLLEKRTDAAIKVGCATVNGVTGVIILPDAFVDPGGNGVFVPINTADPKFTDNVYNFASWEEMESAGAVFLPAAGDGGANRTVQYNQKWVYYWSSSVHANSGTVYSIYIKDDTNPQSVKYDSENYGVWKYTAPVRLVTDAPVAGSTVEDLKVWEDDKSNWE